jgi:hypothetical protein
LIEPLSLFPFFFLIQAFRVSRFGARKLFLPVGMTKGLARK